MSDQGDTGQWRPASHTGPYSEPDEPTGPLPSVSGQDTAAPAFPPVSEPPDEGQAAEDDVPTGGFPSVPAPEPPPSPARRERAPFEPADPPASRPAASEQDPAESEGSAAGAEPGSYFDTEPSTGATPRSAAASDVLTSDDTSGFSGFGASAEPEGAFDSTASYRAETSYEPESSYGSSHGSETPSGSEGPADSDPFVETTAFRSVPSEPDDTSFASSAWSSSSDAAAEPEEPSVAGRRAAAGPLDATSRFESDVPSVGPYDARDAKHGYEVSDPSLGFGTSGEFRRTTSEYDAASECDAPGRETPEVSSTWETSGQGGSPYETTAYDTKPYDGARPAGRRRSFDDVPPPRPFRAPGETYEEPPARSRDAHRTPGEDHDGDQEFFGSSDDPATWNKAVAPSGPPPQPGKPSSGNLRLPDWMREQNGGSPSGPGGEDAYGYAEEGRSKLPLITGVCLLVAGLVAAGGVYLLKGRGADQPSPAAHMTAPGKPGHAKTQQPQQPEKALPTFSGPHTRPVGRIVDQKAGLTYPRLGRPWLMQPKNGQMAELGFSDGQYAVTEKAGGQPKRWARLMSGQLGGADKGAYQGPGTERAAVTRIAATYEAQLYGFRHKKKLLASQPLDIDGHKGWLVGYYLTYNRPASKATGDIFTVALVDTGKRAPGVLLMSVPNTHRTLYPDINYIVQSVRVN